MQFTQEQTKQIISEVVDSKGGLQAVLQMSLEALMLTERTEHNELNADISNGYRSIRAQGQQGMQLQLRVPRSRKGFLPVLLGVLRSQEEESHRLAFHLYSAGLTTCQVGDIFEDIYGKSYSKSSVSRMFDTARQDVSQWLERPLDAYYPIVYIDATYIATRRDDSVSKEAYYTVLGVKADCTREVLGIVNLPTESATGWQDMLQGLKLRGVEEVSLVVSDGLAAIEDAIAMVWPTAEHQLCTVHLQRGVCAKVKVDHKPAVCQMLKDVFVTGDPGDSIAKGWARFQEFCAYWAKKYPSIGKMAGNDRYMRYFTYLGYHYRVRPMIHTTNWIERLNRDYKRTTKMRGALPSPAATLLLLGGVSMEKACYAKKVPLLNLEKTKFRWEAEDAVTLSTLTT